MKNQNSLFQPGDKVREEVDGKVREGIVLYIHGSGDAAEVDYGNGNRYGIMLHRLTKTESDHHPECLDHKTCDCLVNPKLRGYK